MLDICQDVRIVFTFLEDKEHKASFSDIYCLLDLKRKLGFYESHVYGK